MTFYIAGKSISHLRASLGTFEWYHKINVFAVIVNTPVIWCSIFLHCSEKYFVLATQISQT
jgi:hypothetical protein